MESLILNWNQTKGSPLKLARVTKASLRELIVENCTELGPFLLTLARASSALKIWMRAPFVFVLADVSGSSMGSAKP